MRLHHLLALALFLSCCARPDREPIRTTADPPPRPTNVEADAGEQPEGTCRDGIEAYRVDPDRNCRYGTETLCGLTRQSICLRRRSRAVDDEGNCWRLDTCVPDEFDRAPESSACATTPSFDLPYCPDAEVGCEVLGEQQCTEREECRVSIATTRWDAGAGCWRDERAITCEPADLCEPTVRSARLDGDCYITDACTACDDCGPCPNRDDEPACTDYAFTVDVVRIEGSEVVDVIPLATEEPAVDCEPMDPVEFGPPMFLVGGRLHDTAPDLPQVDVAWPMPGTETECPAEGGSVEVLVRAFGEQQRSVLWFEGLRNCTNLYLRVRVQEAFEDDTTYEVRSEPVGPCGEPVLIPDQTVRWDR